MKSAKFGIVRTVRVFPFFWQIIWNTTLYQNSLKIKHIQISRREDEKRQTDMRSRPDTKLDLVEALFYASIIVVLSVVGMISSVR